MYRDRILERKKLLGLSIKTMAERSKLQLPEETLSRLLSSKTHDPRLSTVLEAGEIVGLEPYELFMDAQTSAEFKLYLETKSSNTNKGDEVASLLSHNITLQDEIATLKAEIERLQLTLEHKEEIIRLHNRYNAYIDSLIKEQDLS